MGTTLLIALWAVAFVFFIICEIATGTALVSIWLAFGSLIAMFCAIGKTSFLVQFIVFILSSVVLLIATRPLVKKIQGKIVPTNYELDVGKTAMVTESIDNSVNEGRVKLGGTNWAARSANDTLIEEGTPVTVIKVDGTKLIVEKQ